MATLKELMGDKTRGDGRKFRRSDSDENAWFEPIFKAYDCGEEVFCGIGQDGESYSYSLHKRTDWQEWTPPKKTKKIKMYSPILVNYEGHYVMARQYGCEAQKDTYGPANCVGWHEIEVEVEEE